MVNPEHLIEEAGLAVLFVLAFANGANDVGKSVVSLMVGPGTTGFQPSRRPLLWGGLFSGIGSISAILISGRLFSVFTPQKILGTAPDSAFVLAVLIGAMIWVLLATLVRLPVSTTHAIFGAILLQGIVLFGVSSLAWSFVAIRVILPLAGGPLAALIGIYLFERLRKLTKLAKQPQAAQQENPKLSGVSHWGSAAATAYARGVNDAPKMAVLGAFFIAANQAYSLDVSYSIVAVAVVIGSLVLGHRVARTLSARVVPLDHGQRLRAGVVTAALVSAGAYLGAPLSTTHVHAGTTAGVSGLKETIRSTLRGMILPWLVTLPAAGLLASAVAILGPRILSLV